MPKMSFTTEKYAQIQKEQQEVWKLLLRRRKTVARGTHYQLGGTPTGHLCQEKMSPEDNH